MKKANQIKRLKSTVAKLQAENAQFLDAIKVLQDKEVFQQEKIEALQEAILGVKLVKGA